MDLTRLSCRHLILAVVLLIMAAACASDGATSDGATSDGATSDGEAPEATDAAAEDSGTPGATPTTETAPGSPATEAPAGGGTRGGGDGTLTIGYILPQTGPIAHLGPPEIAGLQLAIDDVNAAGGVLGNDVEVLSGDEAGDPDMAGQAADRQIADGADVIVGAGASGISLAIVDKITGAGLLQCSGSNTSASFTTLEDDGRYFRTAPSNVLQGPVLAERVIADGAVDVGIISRADDYGESLATSTADALEQSGAVVVAEAAYDPAGTTFDAEVRQVIDAEPDAVIVIAFEEGARILRTLLESGIGPDRLYGTDGMPLADLAGLVDESQPGILDGLTATATSSGFDDDFLQRLTEANPDLDTTLFAPHTYDCGAVFALAAIAAGSDDPSAMVEHVIDVTREGTECRSIAECIELLEAGEDIDYTGASGPLDFTEAGEPGIAIYDILQLDGQGEVQTVDTKEAVTQ